MIICAFQSSDQIAKNMACRNTDMQLNPEVFEKPNVRNQKTRSDHKTFSWEVVGDLLAIY